MWSTSGLTALGVLDAIARDFEGTYAIKRIANGKWISSIQLC
jgi:hypothetical protein